MSRVRRLVLMAGMVGILGLGAATGVLFLAGRLTGRLTEPDAAPRAVTARGDLAADEQTTIELFRRCAPSVVYITNLAVRRDFFGLNVTEVPQGTGSGFIWDENGFVVTNFHVLQGGSSEISGLYAPPHQPRWGPTVFEKQRSGRDQLQLPQPRLSARVQALLPEEIFLPSSHSRLVQALRPLPESSEERDNTEPRYAVTVSWGARYEPWVRSFRLLPTAPKSK